mgnify:CR=1|jgi:hypothetical protein|tara:strand:- start:128 stop:304 length:177 start_codon:yes stop_codon:yes gene_type:complete
MTGDKSVLALAGSLASAPSLTSLDARWNDADACDEASWQQLCASWAACGKEPAALQVE